MTSITREQRERAIKAMATYWANETLARTHGGAFDLALKELGIVVRDEMPAKPTIDIDAFRIKRAREDALELRSRMDPALREEYCWADNCDDTNWGGKGRRHYRSKACPKPEDSPITHSDDPRMKILEEEA